MADDKETGFRAGIDIGGTKTMFCITGGVEKIDARHVLQAAAEGDPTAIVLMDQPLEHLAAAAARAAVLLNPQLVVLGGGVAASGDYYMKEIRERTGKYLPFPVNIVPAALGITAGAIGSAAAILW